METPRKEALGDREDLEPSTIGTESAGAVVVLLGLHLEDLDLLIAEMLDNAALHGLGIEHGHPDFDGVSIGIGHEKRREGSLRSGLGRLSIDFDDVSGTDDELISSHFDHCNHTVCLRINPEAKNDCLSVSGG